MSAREFFARWMSGAIVAALVGAGSVGAVALNLDTSGALLGARGVDVNGTLYDVAFLDGDCISLFNGCDSNSDFAFSTQSEAAAAANALLAQVFVDGPAGSFDSSPGLTNGCGATSCRSFIPYQVTSFFGVSSESVFNVVLSSGDGIFPGNQSIVSDTSLFAQENFARFSLSAVAVPVPAALPLMLGGLGVLALVGRRRRGR